MADGSLLILECFIRTFIVIFIDICMVVSEKAGCANFKVLAKISDDMIGVLKEGH